MMIASFLNGVTEASQGSFTNHGTAATNSPERCPRSSHEVTMPEPKTKEKKNFSKKPLFLNKNNCETKDPSLFNIVCFWTRPWSLSYKGIFWVVVVLCKILRFVVSLVSVGRKSLY
jgi:hypothetical protein